ncbi:MAG: hypothetical protein JJT85_07585 [Chromatiales bacterium]|nr:hypothetical protein [Chromatiales bacterium]
MPSSSVLAVSARSASAGFSHGVFTAAGMVLGSGLSEKLNVLAAGVICAQLWLIANA